MKVIVTGATSFLGQALCRRLQEGAFPEPVELISFRHSFEEAPERLPEQADAFLHLAWAGVGSAGRNDKSIQAYNLEMSMAALKKADELGCSRFLFAGSQAEYGRVPHGGGLQREEDPCSPRSEYGKTKLLFGQLGSRWVDSRNEEEEVPLRFIHMRLFSVYGPGDHESSLISSSIKSFLANKAMEFGPCTQDWNYLYIDDAAKAVASLMETEGAQGIYNVAGRDTRPLRDYIEELFKLYTEATDMPLSRETAVNMLKFGMRGDNAEGAVSLRPDIRRITAETGWEPETDFRTGIKKTLEFYKSR